MKQFTPVEKHKRATGVVVRLCEFKGVYKAVQ